VKSFYPIILSLAFFSSFSTQAKPGLAVGPGYKINHVDRGGIYEKLGLVTGDIVKLVNGRSATDEIQTKILLDELQKESSVFKISIERNGKTEELSFNVKSPSKK
jgi:type II secretory pathway component PulC